MNLPQTIVHALHDRASQQGDQPALWTLRHGRYRSTSWRDYEQRVKHCSLGLHALGVRADAKVGILSSNREEWLVSYLAAMACGAVPVGLYAGLGAEQLVSVLGHAEVQVLVVESAAQLERVLPLRPRLPALKQLVVLDPPSPRPEGVVTYVEVLSRGLRESDTGYWERLNGLEPSALATLVHTPGTTGAPKGVMLSHRNLAWTTRRLCEVLALDERDSVLSYLPLSDVAEQVASICAPLTMGLGVYFAATPDGLTPALKEARPRVFFGVPHVWHRLRATAEAEMEALPRTRREVLLWARRVASRRHTLTFAHEKVPTELEAQYRLAQTLVLEPLKDRLGFGRTRLFAARAGPMSAEVLEFFASIDVVVRELYGQAETTGATSVNTADASRLGTVGRPMLGVEVRIGDDGEVLVRGENVCLGYFNDPAATDTLLDDGGWLHSGDLGELDGQGFLRISGRKQEVLVTAGGKKTSLGRIEALLAAVAPVGAPVVVADRRGSLVALLPLDPERAAALARERGWPELPEALAAHPPFREYLRGRMDAEVNAKLARSEAVKAFEVLPRPFSIEGGELTPTRGLRRKAIEQKYRAELDALGERRTKAG